MKQTAAATLTLALSSLLGCAAPMEDEAPSELAVQQSDLTLAECAAQQDACFRKNPLFGIFTCPAQYAQCAATASNGLPAAVSSAITDAAYCTAAGIDCRADAETPSALLACTTAEAECVAAIVGVDLPEVVEGTAECVEGAVACIEDARRVSDLSGCAQSLAGCAVEQVQSVVPEEVGEVIRDVSACQVALEGCIASAETASALALCSEEGAECVASGLGVTLPDVPVSEVVSCTEEATACTLDASSIREITACASGLRECAEDILGSVNAPEGQSCEQQWNACMTKNPFNFLLCGAELTFCRD